MKVVHKIRFSGVFHDLQANDMRAVQGTANLLLISKSICTNCGNLSANFPHHINIRTQVAVILHVYLAIRDTEI